MQIEAGKQYRTLAGNENGVAHRRDGYWVIGGSHYTDDGKYSYRGVWPRTPSDEAEGPRMDLVGSDGPVREVTRKEIVPGTYGHIEVDGTNGAVQPEGVSLWFPRNRRWKANELREAAATLTAIADALEQK